MFHVNAWGLPYAACMMGSKLVFPGPGLDGKSLYELFESERVTLSAGVPTVWQGLLGYVDANDLKFSTMRRTIIGGSACPPAMMKTFQERYDVQVLHAWGMTEMSPVGTVATLKGSQVDLDAPTRFAIQSKQGRAVYGVDMKIVGDDGEELPWDGKQSGELMVRGPWVIDKYFKSEGGDPLVKDAEGHGWFPTGDVADDRRRAASCRSPTARRTSSSRAASGSARSTSRTSPWRIRACRWRRASPRPTRSGTSGRS